MDQLKRPLPFPGLARGLIRRRQAVAGLSLVALFALIACLAPLIASRDPAAIDPMRRLEGPSLRALLGTDALGRDLFSRIVFGARWSLGAAAATTASVLAVGVVIGLVAGFAGGLVDAFLMRLVDGLLAFPALLLALAIVGIFGTGMFNAVLAMTLVGWPTYARFVRALVLALRARPFVEAVRAIGATNLRILVRHVLPNVLSPLVVLATVEMGEMVLALSALSFLGLGAQPPASEWGAMLNEARGYFLTAPRLMIAPGLAIVLAVLGLNLVGDTLRDAFDPRVS